MGAGATAVDPTTARCVSADKDAHVGCAHCVPSAESADWQRAASGVEAAAAGGGNRSVAVLRVFGMRYWRCITSAPYVPFTLQVWHQIKGIVQVVEKVAEQRGMTHMEAAADVDARLAQQEGKKKIGVGSLGRADKKIKVWELLGLT